MKRNSFRAVFERTWTKISQMVMTTDLPCSGNMDQNQFKSDAPFIGNRSPTSAGNSRSERQFTRVLRSKSSTAVKNADDNSEIQKEQLQPSVSIPLTKSPEPEIVNDGSNHKTDAFAQVTHLRQLLLLHLELIQQQQEELQKKDRDINQLKLDKEQLESRMHRLERRMAVKRRRDVNEGYDEVPEEKDVKPVTPKNRRLSVEQMMRAKRVPATAPVTMTSHMCEDVSYDTHIRTEKLYLHGDLPDLLNKTVESSIVDNAQAHVQGNILHSTDDEVFAKRHMKQELEERRRKRWDIQHMRAIQAHQSLEKKHKDREEARLRGKRSGCKDQRARDIESFLPPPEDVMAVEVSDTVPVVAFGFPVPLFQDKEFEIPWFSLDKRELIERKGKVKTGRTRGKPRGKRKGY
ncbi:male-specific lethal 1 homolog [Orbicella faveolata]|uniref:male-specific lethal 1 homolog n=2 Tax=Orbicella faveolata TaxID=48498 RepID=UPI0009E46077|nr:male-specific lethal 1 homolog [Orbicella faveolata]